MPFQLFINEKSQTLLTEKFKTSIPFTLSDFSSWVSIQPDIENGNTILMATHDFSLLKKYNGRILRCRNGLVDEIETKDLEIEKIYS